MRRATLILACLFAVLPASCGRRTLSSNVVELRFWNGFTGPDGRSWRLGGTYLVVEQSPALTGGEHDRLRPGLNHLAFHAGPRQRVDELAADGPAHGWTLLFPDRHPYAGGPEHYAGYLASTDNFEVELVAAKP